MATKRDPRREDLVVPYVAPAKSQKDSDMSGTMASSLPMAAMFTRNKMIGWTAVVFSLQNWLAETPEQKRTASTPGLFQVGMSGVPTVILAASAWKSSNWHTTTGCNATVMTRRWGRG